MTVNTTAVSVTYQGNGATTNFTFPWAMPAGLVTQAQIGANLLVQTVINGITTVISIGNATTQYQATVNAPVAPNPTPIGGSITYNPLGTPLQVGQFLTITRAVPFVQPNSFANQGTSLPSVLEQTHDLEVMLDQQVEAAVVTAIVAPASDPPGINYVLPNNTARANSNLSFDSQGNVTTSQVAAAGVISAAMSPVVGASSLPNARTAMGLGAAAIENLGNSSIGDDGQGNLTVRQTWTSDSTSQAVTSAFNQTRRAATGPITYTMPLTGNVVNGFTFEVFVVAGVVTFTPQGGETFIGVGTGVSFVATNGQWVRLSTNAAGTWYVSKTPGPEDIELDASVASNNLTVTVASRYGWLRFHDPNAAAGEPVWIQIPGSTSITFNSGSTFQQTNNRPFRIWIIGVNNAGVFQLAGFCSFNSPVVGGTATYNLFAINEAQPQSSSASGTTAGVYFQGTQPSFTSKAIRVLGYVEYGSGLATAGVFNTTPSRIRVMTPGMKLPGDTGQLSVNYQAAASNPAVNVAMESACNLVIVNAFLTLQGTTDGGSVAFQLSRSGLGSGFAGVQGNIGSTNGVLTLNTFFIDFPNSAASVTYGIFSFTGTQLAGYLSAQEIYA